MKRVHSKRMVYYVSFFRGGNAARAPKLMNTTQPDTVATKAMREAALARSYDFFALPPRPRLKMITAVTNMEPQRNHRLPS
jgi:hypothetical protein